MALKYKSTLPKECLAYNLIYHLRNIEEDEDPYTLILKIFSFFEDKNS